MEPGAVCPRCGQSIAGEPACPRCGVVFAKLKARPAAAEAVTGPPSGMARSEGRDVPLPARPSVPWGLVFMLTVIVMGGVVGLPLLRSGVTHPPAPPPAAVGPNSLPAGGEVPPPSFVTPDVSAPAWNVEPESASFSAADRAQFEKLAERVNSRAAVGAIEVQLAEDLFSRYADETAVRNLLAAVLVTAAHQERRNRRFPEAGSYLDRAIAVQPAAAQSWQLLVQVALEAGDWTRAEAAARGALGLEPRSADAWRQLGYALLRQDRNRDAAEALKASVEIRPDSSTQSLLDRVLFGMANEQGMTQQQLSHFHVRYDGEAHEPVGREILRALERHYATLTSTLDHQPATAIPVILFSRQGYYTASGAPAWSGGVYDGLDGRIRIPIGGLDAGLSPHMDETLIHELTHAFVADRTRGLAPRDVHEGLAQYLEGKRIASELTPEQLGWLADGRASGVVGFYLEALSFVEYLVANRGMGGMNDLLKVMGETGSVDEAFKRVHGQTHHGTRQAWRQRLRQQHGS